MGFRAFYGLYVLDAKTSLNFNGVHLHSLGSGQNEVLTLLQHHKVPLLYELLNSVSSPTSLDIISWFFGGNLTQLMPCPLPRHVPLLGEHFAFTFIYLLFYTTNLRQND